MADSASAPTPAAPCMARRSNRSRGGVGAIAYSWGIALLLAALPICAALAYPIAERAYDAAYFHVYRSVVFSAARADGWLYPRWVQSINAGLGGPLFSFYSPLLYLLIDLLGRLGVAPPLAWRLLVALAFLLLAAGTFGLALALFRRADVALVSAAAATYAPYLLQELFERGSPQGFAIALYPWLLWLLLRLAVRPSGLRLALAGLCWAAIILIHNVAALLLLPIIALFLAFLAWQAGRRSVLACLAALAIGLLLAACYVVPFVAERGYVQLENASRVDYARPAANPLSLRSLLAPPEIMDTGLGNNSIGQRIGGLEALAVALGAALAVGHWRRRRIATAVLAGGLAAWGLITIWLQTRLATWLWTAVPALGILQFRWRLLGALGLLAAILLGCLLERCRWRCRGALIAGLVVACVGMQLPSLYPQLLPRYTSLAPSLTAADAQAFALQANVPGLTTFNELTPRWRGQPFTEEEAARAAALPIANLPEGARIVSDDRRTGHWRVQLETPNAFDAAFHLLYFPGWAGYVDGEQREVRPVAGSGYLALPVPAGAHSVELRYEGTAVQRAADLVSVLAALLLVLASLFWRPRPGGVGSERAERAGGVEYLQPRWWLLLGLLVVVGLKVGWVDRQTTWLRRSSTCQAVQGAQVQTDVWFGDRLHLCGYTLPRLEYRPGDLVEVTLYWQVEGAAEEEADSFVHLLGSAFNPETNNPLWGQQDKQLPGDLPLTRWEAGRLYRDTYTFRIPAHTPPGEYQLEIGWWEPAAGSRLEPRIGRPREGLSVSDLDALLLSGLRVR